MAMTQMQQRWGSQVRCGMDAHDLGQAFAQAVAGFPTGTPLLLSHDDADGLSSAALLSRAMERAGRPVAIRLVGRGENAWSDTMRTELAARAVPALIVADLGLRAQVLRDGTPTVVIDHHVTTGGLRSGEAAPGVLGLTGFGMEPVPTTSLLSYWCAQGLERAGMAVGADELLWLAAIGLIGDLGEGGAAFAELGEARTRYGITALRAAVTLLNAARRSASGDGRPALALLQRAQGPKEVTSGTFPESATLLAAKAEVAVKPPVALIRLDSPCQIHPLIAQSWRSRLKDQIVMAVNTGFRPGWVHFAMRTAQDVDLVAFLRERAPEGADEQYGNGHRQASGGALRAPVWNRFAAALGFGPEMYVDEMRVAA